MSYCRWSSDDFKCDLYCFADCRGGYTVMVASRRHDGEIPRTPPLNTVSSQEWIKAKSIQDEFLENAALIPIDLPEDGKTFRLKTAQEMIDKVLELRAMGYRIPDYAIERMKKELQYETEVDD